jgi:hypothetical protein
MICIFANLIERRKPLMDKTLTIVISFLAVLFTAGIFLLAFLNYVKPPTPPQVVPVVQLVPEVETTKIVNPTN